MISAQKELLPKPGVSATASRIQDIGNPSHTMVANHWRRKAAAFFPALITVSHLSFGADINPPDPLWLWVPHDEDSDCANSPFTTHFAAPSDTWIAMRATGPPPSIEVPCTKEEILNVGESVMGLTVATNDTIYFADYFGNRVGVVDKNTGRLSALLSDLNAPQAIKAHGWDVYFVEAGTEAGRYHDGALSVLHADAGRREVIVGRLHYPKSLFVDAVGFVYVLEHAGTGTSFGGNDRLIRFAPGANQYEVVLPNLPRANAVVVARDGVISVGNFGETIPGETGELVRYHPGSADPEILSTELPAIQDLAIDGNDNLYLAGFGVDPGTIGIAVVPKGGNRLIPLAKGFQAWCLALDSDRNIYYATGRNGDSIRVLRLCAAAARFTHAMWRPGTGFELAIEGPIATTLRLQVSSDLRSWSDIFTFSNLQRTTSYLDTQAGHFASRFFRVLILQP